jgi:hypothetical protein
MRQSPQVLERSEGIRAVPPAVNPPPPPPSHHLVACWPSFAGLHTHTHTHTQPHIHTYV